ncbi:Peroxisomal membrane protein PMP27 [Orbilia brochopaga]|uniref:Peroxisomal membrane protein PMP27 n=1 Tax=Orbilia brochopaga TaxID=3140254 RepID=A0AAV9VEQ9_9PEZI
MDQHTPPRTPPLEGIKVEQSDTERLELDITSHVSDVISTPSASTSAPPVSSSSRHADILRMASSVPSHMLSPKDLLQSGSLERVFRLLQSANGLDKIIRTIQYTTRLLSHIMLVKNLHTPFTATAAKGIRRQFGLTRRLLRAFNNVSQLDATLKLLADSRRRIAADAIGYTLDLVEGLGYLVFGVADTLGYLPEAGISNIPYRNTVDTLAFHFWLYALVASIVGGVLKTCRLRQRIVKYRAIFPAASPVSTAAAIESSGTESSSSAATTKEVQVVNATQDMPPTPPDSPITSAQVSVADAANGAVKALKEQQLNIELNIVGSLADIVFPLAALKVPVFSTLSDGPLGFAGCISSAVGLIKAWRATAQV